MYYSHVVWIFDSYVVAGYKVFIRSIVGSSVRRSFIGRLRRQRDMQSRIEEIRLRIESVQNSEKIFTKLIIIKTGCFYL